MISTRRATEQAIATLYGNEGTARVIEEMKREAGDTGAGHRSRSDGLRPGGRRCRAHHPLRQLPLIERAFSERASDIHLEPQDSEMVVPYAYRRSAPQDAHRPRQPAKHRYHPAWKIMGGMNISERKIPQGRPGYDPPPPVRAGPAYPHAPPSTARRSSCLLDKSATTLSFQEVSVSPARTYWKYDAPAAEQLGVILIVGFTGSGKSHHHVP